MRRVGRAAADAEDEQPAAARARLGQQIAAMRSICVDIQAVDDLLGFVEKLFGESSFVVLLHVPGSADSSSIPANEPIS